MILPLILRRTCDHPTEPICFRSPAPRLTKWFAVVLALSIARCVMAQPVAILSHGLVTNQVGVTFNTPVTDTDPSKYSLDQAGVTVDAVQLSTPTNLTLSVSGLTSPTYTLTYANVLDAGNVGGSGTISGTNKYALTPIDIGSGAFLPSSYDAIGTPEIPDLTRVTCVGEQIEFNFNFLYTAITGNFDVKVNLRDGVCAPSPNGGFYAFGGVLVRPGLDEFSYDPYIFSGVGLPNSTGLPIWISSYRGATNGAGTTLNAPSRDANVFPNAWLRITRHEQVFNAYYSTNGVDWVPASGDMLNNWPDTLYVGIGSVGYGGQSALPASTFDYGNFSITPLPPTTNATILITQQPTDQTVFVGQPASFSVTATVTNGSASLLTYQWISNNVAIAGATNPVYNIANAYSDAAYSVVISSPQAPNPVTSAVANLTVNIDTTPAVGILSHGLVTNVIGITFDDGINDTNASKFTINQPGVTVNEVRISTPTNLTLILSGLTSSSYQVGYNGILDAAGHSLSGTITGTNKYALTPIDIGSGASLPSSYASIGTPAVPDLTRVTCVGEQIEQNFNFLYTTVTGDFDVRVNLRGGESALSPNGQRYAFGGVVVRTGLEQLSGYLFSGIALPNSSGLPLWLSSYRASDYATAGTLAAPGRSASVFPNAWLRITRVGQVFNAYTSTNGVDWVNANGSTVIDNNGWPDTLYIGLASCGYGGQSAPPASTFDYANFSLTTSSTATPPSIRFSKAGGNGVISWSPGGGMIQSSTNILGPYLDIDGGNNNPFTFTPTNAQTFYRLRR